MSTQVVNADRKGPKDLMDLAAKAQAYKAVLDAKRIHENMNPKVMSVDDDLNPVPANTQTQTKLDEAFEAFANLHRNPETGNVDAAEMQATMEYLNKHLQKGKGL
jgi:hypothetical protein